jgi:hypothetical protein
MLGERRGGQRDGAQNARDGEGMPEDRSPPQCHSRRQMDIDTRTECAADDC